MLQKVPKGLISLMAGGFSVAKLPRFEGDWANDFRRRLSFVFSPSEVSWLPLPPVEHTKHRSCTSADMNLVVYEEDCENIVSW